jgi:hypothetical protein
VIPPDALPPGITVPEGKALVVVYIPGSGYKAAFIPIPGPPGNMPPDVQPVKKP